VFRYTILIHSLWKLHQTNYRPNILVIVTEKIMKNKIQLYATLSEQFQCHTVGTVSLPHCRNSFNATLSEQFQCHTVGTVSMPHCRNSFNATLSEQFQCHTVGTVSMPHCRNSFNATLSEQFQYLKENS
jgi:hypothetical protein